MPNDHEGGHRPEDELEEYGGHIQARHGYVPLWLIAVYLVLFVWSVWYVINEWGGLGPGLNLASP